MQTALKDLISWKTRRTSVCTCSLIHKPISFKFSIYILSTHSLIRTFASYPYLCVCIYAYSWAKHNLVILSMRLLVYNQLCENQCSYKPAEEENNHHHRSIQSTVHTHQFAVALTYNSTFCCCLCLGPTSIMVSKEKSFHIHFTHHQSIISSNSPTPLTQLSSHPALLSYD